MPEHIIRFDVKEPATIELPNRRFAGGHYRVQVDSDGGVDVFGDRDGLLYLAEVLARCALGGYKPGFHVHLPTRGVASGPDVSEIGRAHV